MGIRKEPSGLHDTLDRLVRRAVLRDVPLDIAEEAARATRKAFAGGSYDSLVRFRVEAYFSAVVKRRLIRDRHGSRAVARLMAAAVVADLRESGREPFAVWEELERGWTETIPADVLEEYRQQLCA